MAAPHTTLLIGGTRNLGPALVAALGEAGHRVTVLNRGVTPDDLPPDVERLRADRRDARTLAAALGGRAFDAVVDTTLYTGPDAAAVAEILRGRAGRYVWLSSGQVYLVRPGLARPFREPDYEGPVAAEPARDGPDWADWRYGVDKRGAEDALAGASAARRFPVTTLRLPMVNGERDHHHRVAGYVARLRDGEPILVPSEAGHALRHVDARDVVAAVVRLLATGRGVGEAYNVSQDETVSLDAFVALVAECMGTRPRIVRVERRRLEATGLLPACSPFSDRWMSELDNRKSKTELGCTYTPLRATVARLVAWHARRPERVPPGYALRAREVELARALA